jgi:hypothetical protein
MRCSRIEQNNNGMFVEEERTRWHFFSRENLLHGGVVGVACPWRMTLLMAPLLINHGCWSSRRDALLGQAAFSSEVAHLPTVEAWKVAGGKLLWWPDVSLLRWWSRGTVELLLLLLLRLLLLKLPRLELWVMAPILLLMWSMQLTPKWGIHHAVLCRSTARTTAASGSRHHNLPLFLIGLRNGLHHPLLVDGYTHQLVVQQAGEMCQVLL